MAVTKVLYRNARIEQLIQYVLNGDKTEEQIYTAHYECVPGWEAKGMLRTKERLGKTGGRQCYHLIQSFAPGEITPELALELAKRFVEEHLPGYETVIATHVDRNHIHSHIVFNSVNSQTGKMYHSSLQSYYGQVREITDRLCREYGLSIVMRGESEKAVSYIKWLREKNGQPTFQSMLKADLDAAIAEAGDYGEFLILMENMGYEIKHGNRLGFRLLGQERFRYPERKDKRYSEEGICAAISGNLEQFQLTGVYTRKVFPYKPYVPHPRFTGFLGLCHHYLYLLESLERREIPRHTRASRAEVMKFEKYKRWFGFMLEHDLKDEASMRAFQEQARARIELLSKQRTQLNVKKKRRARLYDALATETAFAPVVALYLNGTTGIEEEYMRYEEAGVMLDACGISRQELGEEKRDIYQKLAEINQEIKAERRKIQLCDDILADIPRMELEVEQKEEEVTRHEHRQR